MKHPFNAYSGDEPYIFICYSHKDSDYVYEIINSLNDKGFRIWYDEGCEPGYDWGDFVDEKIKNCRAFMVFVSANMLQSRISRNELEIAADDMYENQIRLIPINIDDSALTGKLNVQLHGIQQIRKSVFGERLVDKIVEALPPETCSDKTKNKNESKQSNGRTISANDIAAISEGFIYRELKKYFDADDIAFEKIQRSYSRIFIHVIDNYEFEEEDNIFSILVDKFFGAKNGHPHVGKYFLKLSGGCGTGKSTFMQILYLSILRKKNRDFTPVYYNLSFYENKIAPNTSEFISDDLKMLEEYFKNSGNTPIVFIDGVNTCLFSESPLDNLVYDCLKEIAGVQEIVCIEDNFTCNPERTRRDAYITNKASIELSFSSIDLIEVNECKELLKCAAELGRVEHGDELLSYFKKNQFYETDLFLIDKFGSKRKDIDIYSKTIYDWIEDILRHDYRCDDKFLSVAGNIAYHYCYTNDKLADILHESTETAMRAFSIMRSHKFFNDYLIARHYVERLLDYEEGEDLEFFEMVLPKQVTRFIIAKINKDILVEEEFHDFFINNYAKFSTLGKSAASFYLGRLKSTNLKRTGTQFLLAKFQAHKDMIAEKLAQKVYGHKGEYMDDLFNLRGISVSLIGCGEKDIFKEYIENLIANPDANEINRGFHLEYYGDKIYIPGTKMLDYMDALSKGEKTMQYLCKGLDDFIFEGKETRTGEVMLFTLCSLIQARIEKGGVYKHYDLKKYIKKAIDYIEQYRRNFTGVKRVPQNIESDKFDNYLKSVKRDFIDYNAEKNIPIETSFYNIYSDANKIKRTGWVRSGIENPENIVEHSFNLMLLTMFYIPTKDTWGIYDKDKIMKMLFIHDLAETVLGDIPKPDKQSDIEGKYDKDEDLMMKQLLLKGTYPSVANLDEYYQLWEEFRDQKTEDAKLAKDIDVIQAVYQFKKYQKKHPDNFPAERVQKWLDEYYALKTDFGRELFQRLIIDNTF